MSHYFLSGTQKNYINKVPINEISAKWKGKNDVTALFQLIY